MFLDYEAALTCQILPAVIAFKKIAEVSGKFRRTASDFFNASGVALASVYTTIHCIERDLAVNARRRDDLEEELSYENMKAKKEKD